MAEMRLDSFVWPGVTMYVPGIRLVAEATFGACVEFAVGARLVRLFV